MYDIRLRQCICFVGISSVKKGLEKKFNSVNDRVESAWVAAGTWSGLPGINLVPDFQGNIWGIFKRLARVFS
jgi:hypothetical protein